LSKKEWTKLEKHLFGTGFKSIYVRESVYKKLAALHYAGREFTHWRGRATFGAIIDSLIKIAEKHGYIKLSVSQSGKLYLAEVKKKLPSPY